MKLTELRKEITPYLLLLIALSASLWLFVIGFRERILDENFAIWKSKLEFVNGSQDFDLLIFGDSKALSGIIPQRLPMRAASLATNGTSPIAQYFLLKEYLKRHQAPKKIIYSVSAIRFHQDEYFWYNTAKFYEPQIALMDVFAVASELKDSEFTQSPIGMCSVCMLARLYALKYGFPFLYRADIVQSVSHLRKDDWRNISAGIFANLGYWPAPIRLDKLQSMGREANFAKFRASPVLQFYFEQFLELTERIGTEVHFVVVPTNPISFATISPAYRSEFSSFLTQMKSRHKNLKLHFEMATDELESFADQDHLNARGAEKFTARIVSSFFE